MLLLLCVTITPSTAWGEEHEPQPSEEATMDPATLFKTATDALNAERPTEAIGKLEALADRGVVDAVVSYNRGLAYAARVRAGGEQVGDLGRAAHGFEEAKELTRDPQLTADATSALATVRSEVARRRSRSGDPVEIEHGFSLGRAIVDLLPENVWAVFAGMMAIILSFAIIIRRKVDLPRAKVAATTAASIAGAFLFITSILSWAARDARLHLREGIVVQPNARLLDTKHLAIEGVTPLPEGVRARIVDESAGFSKITVGGAEGFLPSSSVLPLTKR
jgi:hypothetical protein